MIRCIAIDDEPLALNLLKNYISNAPELELVLATTDVYKALQLAQQQGADLIFLDIQMPELTGIQFMKILNGSCKIILTTAYEEYALQAFEHDVVDYLLKPFSPDRFMMAVNKAKERLALPQQKEARPADHIFVRSGYKMVRIPLADILYFESLRDYIAIHTKTGKLLTLQSLRSFEEQLAGLPFVRIHKSYIVAVDKIGSVERKKLVINQTELPISETYQESFRKKISLP